jgi:hypothetical protein
VQFRLENLDDARGKEVLERCARLANWQTRPSPQRDESGEILRGRGVT